MGHLPDHPISYPLSTLSPSQTKDTSDSTSVRGVSSKHYGTIKSTPVASRMYSKPYTTDTKPSPMTTPRPPKSRLLDSAKKPSPEDPIVDRRAIAYQKYRGRLIDALIKECRSRDLPTVGTKSDLIFRLVEDDLSHSTAKSKPPLPPKSPGSPFSIPSRLNPSAAVSPRANLPRSLLNPVKPFTQTTEQTSQLAAETNSTLREKKELRIDVSEKGAFAADSDRTFENTAFKTTGNDFTAREAKRPPEISYQLFSEGTHSVQSKPPIHSEVHAKEPVITEPTADSAKPEIEPHNVDDEE